MRISANTLNEGPYRIEFCFSYVAHEEDLEEIRQQVEALANQILFLCQGKDRVVLEKVKVSNNYAELNLVEKCVD